MRPKTFYAAVLGIAALNLLLRLPSLWVPVWNVDEAVAGAVANAILDGGVVYRDSVDHRGPVTYYLYALVFAAFGRDNMTAIHAVLIPISTATALAVIWIARLGGLRGGALFAGLMFVVLSSVGLPGRDVYAFHTEWSMILFACPAAALFVRGLIRPQPGVVTAVAGAGFGLAFLSKQPAALDALAAALLLAWAAFRRPADLRVTGFGPAFRYGLWFLAGFLPVVGACVAYFVARRAWSDFLLYFWTYNREYYLPAMSPTQRALGLIATYQGATTPFGIGALAAAGIGVAVYAAVRNSPPAHLASGRDPTRPGAASSDATDDAASAAARPSVWVYWSCWGICALVGSSLSARAFPHYFIQLMPAWSLLAGLTFGTFARRITTGTGAGVAAGTVPGGDADRPPAAGAGTTWVLGRGAVALFVACLLVYGVLAVLWAGLEIHGAMTQQDAPLAQVARHVRDGTRPGDRVFVWGFNPEIYTLSGRRPATRYSFCTFMVGLIPWVNVDPAVDTSEWVVPNTMNTMVRELARNRPRFIVDTSVGDVRAFGKYPPWKYPALARLLEAQYEVDPVAAANPAMSKVYRVYRLTGRR